MKNEIQCGCAARVDVIVPVYNQAEYVEALLKSIGEADNTDTGRSHRHR